MFAILTGWFVQISKFYDNKDCILDVDMALSQMAP